MGRMKREEWPVNTDGRVEKQTGLCKRETGSKACYCQARILDWA